jgi:flagellar basal-body rod protein FlgF
MERGLYIAASGMMSEMVRQDQLANDLANASTPGYKADRTAQRSFGDMLLTEGRSGRAIGELGTGVEIAESITDLTPAALRDTGEPLDFGVSGDGFFAVRTAEGVRYTRNGRFTLDATGQLTTATGNPVLSQGGTPVRADAAGSVDPAAVGLFAVPDARKAGESLFTGAPGGRGTGTVQAGAIEASGVEPARAMVDMMASLRAFEAGQRVITTIDGTLQKAVSQVGSIG